MKTFKQLLHTVNELPDTSATKISNFFPTAIYNVANEVLQSTELVTRSVTALSSSPDHVTLIDFTTI